jgi:hypothetical protein
MAPLYRTCTQAHLFTTISTLEVGNNWCVTAKDLSSKHIPVGGGGVGNRLSAALEIQDGQATSDKSTFCAMAIESAIVDKK